MAKKDGEWRKFFSFLGELTHRGFGKPAPFFYFISVILTAGSVGFWYPFIDTGTADLNSAMTYVFALLAAIVADFFTSDNHDRILGEYKEFEKDFTILIISIVIFIACLTVISVILKEGFWAWVWMALSSTLLWFLWWILLEHGKFGITRDGVRSSTIGDTEFSSGEPARKLTLKELKEKQSQGGKNA